MSDGIEKLLLLVGDEGKKFTETFFILADKRTCHFLNQHLCAGLTCVGFCIGIVEDAMYVEGDTIPKMIY